MKTTLGMLAMAIAFSAATAGAQGSAAPARRFDARWTPYLGCWRLLQENVRTDGAIAAPASPAAPAITVCVQPSGTTTGVTLTTFAGGKPILEQTIVADASGRPVADSGCTGSQTSEWSRDGYRLFTHVDLACNDRPQQSISGLTMFAKGPSWLDIQATSADGQQQQVRIRRYVRTSEQPEGSAALAPDVTARAVIDALAASVRMLKQEDVTEASAKVASQVVEAAIVETEARFALNSRALNQLADAGVSPNVIDLMVAQSFPSHFRVERPVTLPPSAGYEPVASNPMAMGSAVYPTPYPFYSYGAYDPYYYYSYYYSPFAYPYYWGNNGYYRGPTYFITGGGTTVVVPGGSTGNANSDHGRLVNGVGYTSVHPASGGDSAAPATRVVTPGRAVKGTSGSGADSGAAGSSNAGSSSSGSSGSSSGGGGSVSSGGYSGGGGVDTGRTAQPK